MTCRPPRRSMDLLVSSARVGVRAASGIRLFGIGCSVPFPIPGGCYVPRRFGNHALPSRLFGCFDTRAQLFPPRLQGVPAAGVLQ